MRFGVLTDTCCLSSSLRRLCCGHIAALLLLLYALIDVSGAMLVFLLYSYLLTFLFSVFQPAPGQANFEFNNDISKWDTGAVTDMSYSTFCVHYTCILF